MLNLNRFDPFKSDPKHFLFVLVGFVYFLFWGFELGFMLAKRALYHLGHTLSPKHFQMGPK
jgi:hypothetical protein